MSTPLFDSVESPPPAWGPFRFQVLGIPATKGSTRSFGHIDKKTGRVKVVTTSDNKRLRPWEALIQDAVRDAPRTSLPVSLEAEFTFPRPASHLNSKGELRRGKPLYPTSRNDLDKLERALIDGLAAVLLDDDGQVVEIVARKRYAEPGEAPGVRGMIFAL